MATKKKALMQMAPIIGSSFSNWMTILRKNGNIPFKFYPRIAFITFMTVLGIPFNAYERWRMRKKIAKVQLKDPVFIMGHWRSGTTHLQNIFSKDKRFGYVANVQCLFPHAFAVTGFFKMFLKVFMPKTRPMDNMKLELDTPQEEELAMMCLCPQSFYTGWLFPKNMMQYYKNYIKFEDVPESEFENWKKTFIGMLKKAAVYTNSNQLVLKNPPNTARIKSILKVFPNAKFIHITRDPYKVFVSTHQLYKTAMPFFQLQTISKEETDQNIIDIYKDMMETYYKEETLIPKGNLVTLKFEDLQKHPIEEMTRVYETLNLPNFKETLPHIETYLDSRKGYKKNKYELDESVKQTVENQWGFVFDKMGYTKWDERS